MSKYRKRYSSSKCPEPINTMLDIAGALTLGAIAKRKVKKDYAKGEGPDSVAAARAVFGAGSLRRGSAGIMNLGGLYGVESALRDLEKEHRSSGQRRDGTSLDDDFGFTPYSTNNNRYAWRLNCADGRKFGIDPKDYETREEYNAAINKAANSDSKTKNDHVSYSHPFTPMDNPSFTSTSEAFLFCKVSRLDNGENRYYLSRGQVHKIGDSVMVPDGKGGHIKGIVLSVEKHTRMTAPQVPEETEYIIEE